MGVESMTWSICTRNHYSDSGTLTAIWFAAVREVGTWSDVREFSHSVDFIIQIGILIIVSFLGLCL